MNSNGMIKTLSKEEIGIFSEEISFIYKEAMHTSDEAANMLIQRINKSQALVISFFNEEKMWAFYTDLSLRDQIGGQNKLIVNSPIIIISIIIVLNLMN